MKQLKRIPFTKEGLDRVVEELDGLKKSRPEAVLKLAEARSMGDLSENGLYTAAKGRLRSMDSRIFNLEMQIKLAEIVEGGTDKVSLGSKVTVLKNGVEKTFQIVGDLEANPKEGKITQHSPLGKALIGKAVGNIALVNLQTMQDKYVVKEIE